MIEFDKNIKYNLQICLKQQIIELTYYIIKIK